MAAAMPKFVEPTSEPGMKHWHRVIRRTGIFPKDRLRSLPDPATCMGLQNSLAGIYFLWFGPALIYIGQSRCVATRLSQHEDARDGLRGGKRIPFSRATFLDLTDSDWLKTHRQAMALDDVELAYIRLYRPPYNVKGLQ